MKVTEETKQSFFNTSSHKEIKIYFPDLDYTVDKSQIYEESMRLEESLIEGNSIEFVGCISSQFEIQVNGIRENLKGQRIEVSIKADDTEEIPLFHGIVDSAIRQSNRNYKKITAYDELYTKGNIDVAQWYNSLTFPISLKDFRDSLFAYIGIEQEERNLPNDSMTINKEYAPTTLQARVVFKSICQINGAFGIINRYGKFEYRILTEMIARDGAYPGTNLYPPFYPGTSSNNSGTTTIARNVPFYKKVDYEDYSVKPVNKLTIRQSESESGIVYGNGTNNYIIQGNMFTLNKSESEIKEIAKNIYNSIAGVEFTPFTSDNSGYPFIEVGVDGVNYVTYDFDASAMARSGDVYTERTFYVFKRTMNGIQALKDSYSVEGEEYQTEFITDVNARIDSIKQDFNNQIRIALPEYTYSKPEIDKKFEQYTGGVDEDAVKEIINSMFVSVSSLPTDHASTGIWYFVRDKKVE